MTTVITGDLETRVVDFALSVLDRKALLHYAFSQLDSKVDAYHGEKTNNLKTEVTNFVNVNMGDTLLTGFAIRQLIFMFESYGKNASVGNIVADFSTDLVKLGSSISIVFCSSHDDELVREFVSFLFSLSESSGTVLEQMPPSIAQKFLRVLCNYASRALKEYCVAKGY